MTKTILELDNIRKEMILRGVIFNNKISSLNPIELITELNEHRADLIDYIIELEAYISSINRQVMIE